VIVATCADSLGKHATNLPIGPHPAATTHAVIRAPTRQVKTSLARPSRRFVRCSIVQAPVEIRYEGVVIDRITGVTGNVDSGAVVQLPTAEPMPVGTRLELWNGSEVSYVRVVRVTEAVAGETAAMHVRAMGLSEPFEVTLLPNPEYYESRAKTGEVPRSPEPPLPAPVLQQPMQPPLQPPLRQRPEDAQAVPEPVAAETSTNGAGEHPREEISGEISGLIDTGASSEMPAAGNGANNKRRRRRRR
jgi:hypothetical protein